MSVAANLFSVIAPAGPAKGAGKTAGPNADDSTTGAQGGASINAGKDSAKTGQAADSKTSDNDDQANSPFADALAAALGVVLQPVLPQIAATPKDASAGATAVSGDGKAAAPVLTAGQASTTATDAAAATAAVTATPAPVTTQAIITAANDIKAADPKTAASTPTAGPTVQPAEPAPATINLSPAPPAPLSDSSVSAPKAAQVAQSVQPSAPPTTLPVTPVLDQTTAPDQTVLALPLAAQAALEPVVAQPKAPAAPTVDKLASSSPSKAKGSVAEPETTKTPASGAAPSKPDTVETLTEKAVAAADDATPGAPATPDKAATDPSLLLASAQAAAPQALGADAPKVTAHTVAHLAAQIASNVDGKSTRFDVTLNPEGLGKVDVRVDIDARGQMTAQLNFASADAAAQMQSKAAELHTALTQAGFDPSKTSLSFNSGGAQQQPWQDPQNQNQGQPSWTGRAFTSLSDQSDELALAPSWARRASGGVDVRI